MSHCLHWHKNSCHEAFSTHGMSIAAMLEVWHKYQPLEQFDNMPERNNFVGWYIETFFQYKISMKLLKNTVGNGYNLSDDRSHKVQYTDPITGYFHSR